MPCPDLKACDRPITENMYNLFCSPENPRNQPGLKAFEKCHYYQMRRNGLVTPVRWLQKKAIKADRVKKRAQSTVKATRT